MSDFFTPPPRDPEPVYQEPAWLGPPANELGVPVALRAVLARTDDVALALLDVVAFSNGLQFGPLRDAAASSEQLWPGSGPASGGGTVSQVRIG